MGVSFMLGCSRDLATPFRVIFVDLVISFGRTTHMRLKRWHSMLVFNSAVEHFHSTMGSDIDIQ